MSVGNLAPALKQQWFNNGVPLSGGQLFSYQAGTTTPQNTYTDQTMGTANTNPVVLDVNGEANVWLDPTLSYKFVLEDASNNVLWTVDNVVGNLAAGAVDTAAIQAGAVTTACLADNAVTNAILASDPSVDANRAVQTNHIRDQQVTAAKLAASAISLPGISNIGLSTSVASNAMTVTLTDSIGAVPSTTSPVDILFQNATVTTGYPILVQITATLTLTIPSGATLGGTPGGQNQDIWVYAVNNAGTLALAVAGSKIFDETVLQSTTAISSGSTASNTLYSASALTTVPVRLIGRITSNQTSAGVYASNAVNVSTYFPDIIRQPSEIVITAPSGYGSTNTMFRTFESYGLLVNNGADITYASSATLGDSFKINTPGYYAMSYTDNFSAAQFFGITRNDTFGTTALASVTLLAATNILATASASAANIVQSMSVIEYLNAGDVIRCHTGGTSSGTNTIGQVFRIIRIA